MDSQGATNVGTLLHTQAALSEEGSGVFVSGVSGIRELDVVPHVELTTNVHILHDAQASSHCDSSR